MAEKETALDLVGMNKEITTQLKDEGVKRALLATTFKGLDENNMRKAAMEGMMRGFNFKSFLDRDVYAIPYGSGYSLVESVDYIRKVGMRAGIVGKSAPTYTWEDDKKPETCTITVKRLVHGYVGEYTATVFFSEFSTGKSLWQSKPRMMLAKVAEMHALRMACPEELAHAYIEEEMESEIVRENNHTIRVDDMHSGAENLKMGHFVKNENNQEGADAPHQDDAESIEVGEEQEGKRAGGKK